jgi:hypothetical protein
MEILEFIRQPWPWYIGPLSWTYSSGIINPWEQILWYKWYFTTRLRNVYASRLFLPTIGKRNMEYVFCIGILIGGIAFSFLSNPDPIIIDASLRTELATYGITNINGMLPEQIFSWENLFTLKGFIMIVIGGFLIGFGSRYAEVVLVVTHFRFV